MNFYIRAFAPAWDSSGLAGGLGGTHRKNCTHLRSSAPAINGDSHVCGLDSADGDEGLFGAPY